MITIENIRDVLPSIRQRPEFRVVDQGAFTVVDYTHQLPGSFEDHLRRELRGVKFDRKTGRVLARPLHKFFNVNENDEVRADRIDWNRSHFVTEKIDGSMVHTVVVNNTAGFMTRSGASEQSRMCERGHLSQLAKLSIHELNRSGLTAIMEWTSPRNQVVVYHDVDALTLLAIRENVSGAYVSLLDRRVTDLPWLRNLRRPRVLASNAYGDWHGLARHTEGLIDAEGFVIWFTDGLEPRAVKVKAPWYVMRHRARDELVYEKNVLGLILTNGLDDVLPLVSPSQASRLRIYATKVQDWLAGLVALINMKTRGVKTGRMTRKELALRSTDSHRLLRAAMFSSLDRDTRAVLVDLLLKRCAHGPTIHQDLLELGGPLWNS